MLKSFEWLAVLAAVVLLLSVAGISYLSSPPPDQPREQQAATQAQAENQGEKQHSLRGFIRFMFPDAISIFTFWLTLATICLGVVAVLQIGFLDRSERISAQAAKAAKESADAAKSAVELSDRTAERQLRAYVFPRGGQISNFGADKKFEVNILLKNSGRTPAYEFMAEGAVSVGDYPLTEALTTEYGGTGNVGLGPGTEYNIKWVSSVALPQVFYNAVVAGTKAIYANGVFSFRDAFDKPHKGTFTLFFGGKTGTPQSGEMSFYEHGNE